jgi:uncharacterized protein (TIGR02117 family)
MALKKQGIFFLRILKRVVFSLTAVLGVYLFFSILFSLLPTHPPDHACPAEAEVFISSNGVHLDIIVPVDALDPQIFQQLDVLPHTQFISFGWGDKLFYVETPEWSDLTFYVAMQALFLKSESAMHVTCLPRSFPSWKRLALCEWQLQRLNDYIHNSFKTTESGDFIKMSCEGYNPYDAFYDARGSFSLFRTCNVWVNSALKEMEVKTSVWSPFDLGVLYHMKQTAD